MQITGTHFKYFLICLHKLWIFANSIEMEHASDLVSERKLVYESTYSGRANKHKDLSVDCIKTDCNTPFKQVVLETYISKSIVLDCVLFQFSWTKMHFAIRTKHFFITFDLYTKHKWKNCLKNHFVKSMVSR